ncbi:MAG: hypothetical protein ACAH95_02410 [Fimbriimonas sp.]
MKEIALSRSEIEASFPNEWVLVIDPELESSTGEVLGGIVAAHSASRDDVYDTALQLKPRRSAVLCLRTPGDGTVLVV